MKTALQRELSVTLWQAVGALLALGLLTGLGAFWGQHLEGRIDSVIDDRQHDHRVLRELVHEARPVAMGKTAEPGAGTRRESAPATGEGGSEAGLAPGNAANDPPKSPPKPTEPRHEPPSVPGQGGGEAGSVPSTTAAPMSTPLPEESPGPADIPVPPALPNPPTPALVPKALDAIEQAGKQAGGVVDQAGCDVGGLLGDRCP